MRNRHCRLLPRTLSAWVAMAIWLPASAALAAPAPPGGAHPRLFLSSSVRTAFTAAASDSNSAVSVMIARCQALVDKPSNANSSGYQGFDWADAASSCALAWQVTGQSKYADMGVKIWRALLEDIDTLGDKKACVAGANEATAVASIRRDTGYALRMIGPHTAIAYDWLHDAPGVTEAFRQQTRDCFRNWITYYTREGFLRSTPGANYHAGFVGAKTLIAIAEAGEDGASSDKFWTETVDDVFGKQLIANGLAQDNGGVPKGPGHGALVGGDWPEGWQYGPLSITEYGFATRALLEQGVEMAPLSAWANDITLREIYGLLPNQKGKYIGGDTSVSTFFADPNGAAFNITRMGPGSDQVAGWASFMSNRLFPGKKEGSLWQALADARGAAAVDPTQASLPLWYLARGTRNLYARNSWDADAFWAVFTSAPRQVPDHQHPNASNFVFTRGGDALVVDPSPYASRSTLTGNAVTVDSNVVTGNYAPSQTPSSAADLPLARGTMSGVVAARSDFAKAFNFTSTPSDIQLALRDWVFLPEGEVITIDRVRTPSANHKAYLRFRTAGMLTAASSSPFIARAPSGGSALAIHAVKLVPSTAPTLQAVPAMDAECPMFGACRLARVAVGEYLWEVPGPDVLAIHVLDGLGGSEAAADVAPLDAAPIDDGGQNAGVLGASVFRAQKQTFVVEPATLPAPATLTYGVPGGNPSRHIVFDAPADGMSRTQVTATAQGGRCVVTLAAGQGVTGKPAIFTLATAANGCTVSEDANVPPGSASPGSGGFEKPNGGGPGAGGGSGTGTGGSSGSGTGSGGNSGSVTGAAGNGPGLGGGTVSGGCSCMVGDAADASSLLRWATGLLVAAAGFAAGLAGRQPRRNK
jgi:hypothetical protein